jgi:hypothetical protein
MIIMTIDSFMPVISIWVKWMVIFGQSFWAGLKAWLELRWEIGRADYFAVKKDDPET